MIRRILALFVLLPGVLLAQNNSTHNYKLEKDVLWASPEGFDLTMDIYTPDTGKDSYPVLIIYHGGGWLINNKSIMDEMSQYVASHGEYVVCNVNYRLLGDQDNTVTMDEIVGDVFGALLWVKEHVAQYNGDPKRVAVTGDSAGGHLASMVVLMENKLNDCGFSEGPDGFRSSYIPEGKKLKKLVKKGGMEVQAGLISYGAFDLLAACQGDFEQESNFFWQMGGAKARPIFGDSISVTENPEYYKMVSPIYNIPKASERKLPPQLLTVGSKDDLTTPELVSAYKAKLEEAGHPVEYWVHEGRPHAFLDSGTNDYLGISFDKDAIPALEVMLDFLDKVL